ncbi:MAG: DUF1957 domain-containing protein [Candidatus Electryonea clarkiae]|nr:DUF1957 domain-containing protein [Candidatus Electryonea clarkiae]MDP8287952.1 DUF1957 domain-containing protein [Candidatus Electryonea clarkiae]
MNNDQMVGKFTFVLHSHLPYVLSHGKWPHGMVWLSEAASETYIPFWRVFNRLHEEGKNQAVTIGITPVLAEQLADPGFKYEFKEYLEMKQTAAEADIIDFEKRSEHEMAKTARFWLDWYRGIEDDFRNTLGEDIIGAFADLQDKGAIEIITSAATHGYLPLLGTDEAVETQIRVGVETYKKHFGRDPKGIWLPECAYRPGYHWVSPEDENGEGFDRKGIEFFLQKYGIRYFIVDTHLLKGGTAQGVYLQRFEGLRQLWDQAASGYVREKVRDEDIEKTPYRVYWVDGTTGGEGDPIGILSRDSETSLQVWSGEYGYPGDGQYLDFHKKHFPGGHRYWRVTDSQADLGDKGVYELGKVEERLEENAHHFVSIVEKVLSEQDNIPVENRQVVSPFDTELFGHWWFEGVNWIEKVLRKVDESPLLKPSKGSELIESLSEAPVVRLPEGSWGEGGFHYIWYNNATRWTWKIVHEAEKSMTLAARKYGGEEGEIKEILAQLGRELLLLESSDWQFLISTKSARDYAELRFNQHSQDFTFLHTLLEKISNGEEKTAEEWERYQAICQRDSLFADLDPNYWV